MNEPPKPTNRFGRRGGRGLRPWLLIPKLICVALTLGGFASALLLLNVPDDAAPHELAHTVDLVRTLFRRLIVPALILALLLGVGLLLTHHPAVLLRLRWLQVKLAIIVITLPLLHLTAYQQMAQLRSKRDATISLTTPTHQITSDPALSGQSRPSLTSPDFAPLTRTTWAGLLTIITLLTLARLKPTLGQNWAHAYKPPARG